MCRLIKSFKRRQQGGKREADQQRSYQQRRYRYFLKSNLSIAGDRPGYSRGDATSYSGGFLPIRADPFIEFPNSGEDREQNAQRDDRIFNDSEVATLRVHASLN